MCQPRSSFRHLKARWHLDQTISSLEVIQAATIPHDNPEEGERVLGKFIGVDVMNVLGIKKSSTGAAKQDFDSFKTKALGAFLKSTIWEDTQK